LTLDPIALQGISLGIGRPVNIDGNRISWMEPAQPSACPEGAAQAIAEDIGRFIAVLPVLLAPALSDISLLDFFAAGVDDPGRRSRDAPRRRSILY
jgi:hypothetical protein